jgi:hypothetical protein
LDLKGAGVSTTQYNSNTGIATIFFEGGGGGSISISTTAPTSPGSGDLWYSPDYGRTFIYYDESVVGYGTDAFWVDAAPFNVGIITSLTNVSFVPGSASNPSMFFVGDSQTGFFSPTSGQFTFVSVGSSILNINPSGINVTGIVTANSFIGNGSGLTGISSVSFATTAFNLIGTASTASFATTSFNLIGTASTASFATTSFNLIGTASTASFATTSFNLIGTASTASFATTSFGLSGSPNINITNLNVSGVSTLGSVSSLNVTGNAIIGGDLTVNGTQTIINTQVLDVADKNIGIGSTSSPTDALADGSGITIYGTTNKTITWENDTGCFEYSEPNKFKGVVETVAVGSTYDLGSGNVVLELDVRNATTYTHSLSNGSVGIVSFKNMPADTGVSNGTTITVIFTQNSAGTANTTAATGIGTNITVIGFEDGATVAGISTRALVGSATTVTLSTTGNDRDFVSFFVHYTGGTNTTASSYQVYATKNGGFRQGT